MEKKVLVDADGKRRVVAGNVQEFGPKGFAVTWQALATLAVMVGQFAIPLHRLGTMLSSPTKNFTATSLSRMAHYVAERLLPIYLTLLLPISGGPRLFGTFLRFVGQLEGGEAPSALSANPQKTCRPLRSSAGIGSSSANAGGPAR